MPGVTGAHLAWIAQQLSDRPELWGVMSRRREEGGEILEPFPSAYRRSARRVIAQQLAQERRALYRLCSDAGFSGCGIDWSLAGGMANGGGTTAISPRRSFRLALAARSACLANMYSKRNSEAVLDRSRGPSGALPRQRTAIRRALAWRAAGLERGPCTGGAESGLSGAGRIPVRASKRKAPRALRSEPPSSETGGPSGGHR